MRKQNFTDAFIVWFYQYLNIQKRKEWKEEIILPTLYWVYLNWMLENTMNDSRTSQIFAFIPKCKILHPIKMVILVDVVGKLEWQSLIGGELIKLDQNLTFKVIDHLWRNLCFWLKIIARKISLNIWHSYELCSPCN